MIVAQTNYTITLDGIEKVKNAMKVLDKTAYSHLPQGIMHEYDNLKTEMINWLEEMEYEVSNYTF